MQGECNDVPGMFPEAFVERLFGADPPTSKETLLFQATCLYEEAGERRLQLLDALTQPDKHTGRIPKSLSMQLDDKFYFVEYAKKVRACDTGNAHARGRGVRRHLTPCCCPWCVRGRQYFNPSKRGKSLINVKSAIHSIRVRSEASRARRSSVAVADGASLHAAVRWETVLAAPRRGAPWQPHRQALWVHPVRQAPAERSVRD